MVSRQFCLKLVENKTITWHNVVIGLPVDEEEMRSMALEELASCQEEIKNMEHEVCYFYIFFTFDV